jgi:hypothetical protein
MADESQLRPRVFIGSSREGHSVAKALQQNLDYSCEVTIWSQGVFGLGEGTLESLARGRWLREIVIAACHAFAAFPRCPTPIATFRAAKA